MQAGHTLAPRLLSPHLLARVSHFVVGKWRSKSAEFSAVFSEARDRLAELEAQAAADLGISSSAFAGCNAARVVSPNAWRTSRRSTPRPSRCLTPVVTIHVRIPRSRGYTTPAVRTGSSSKTASASDGDGGGEEPPPHVVLGAGGAS